MVLSAFFQQNPKVAVAFSGGVDSAYLLYAAKACGADVHAYYVKAAFQPAFELADARKLSEELQVDLTVLPVDVLSDEAVVSNPANRCYYCKQKIFSAIASAAAKDGYEVLLDGTNASDAEEDRPGMKALRELQVRSPLRECGLTKPEIRARSKEAGLFTWDKPAYACLATRIPTGQRITADALEATERAESFLFSLGLENFRVRRMGNVARLQFPESELQQLMEHRKEILEKLKPDYEAVLLDLEVRDEK